MDEKRIQQVLEIEKQAQQIYDAAQAEASNLPIQAEKEAQSLLVKTRVDAEEEARKIIASATVKEEYERILTEAEEKVRHNDTLAKSNFNRAVAYVIDKLTGKE